MIKNTVLFKWTNRGIFLSECFNFSRREREAPAFVCSLAILLTINEDLFIINKLSFINRALLGSYLRQELEDSCLYFCPPLYTYFSSCRRVISEIHSPPTPHFGRIWQLGRFAARGIFPHWPSTSEVWGRARVRLFLEMVKLILLRLRIEL